MSKTPENSADDMHEFFPLTDDERLKYINALFGKKNQLAKEWEEVERHGSDRFKDEELRLKEEILNINDLILNEYQFIPHTLDGSMLADIEILRIQTERIRQYLQKQKEILDRRIQHRQTWKQIEDQGHDLKIRLYALGTSVLGFVSAFSKPSGE